MPNAPLHAVNDSNVTTSNVNSRPSRAAKRRALNKIQNIHHWENCSESSVLFRHVARQLDHEIQNEILQEDEVVNGDMHTTENRTMNSDESDMQASDDESISESMKDFIVSDDEGISEDDSETSFNPNEDEDEELEPSSDDESEISNNEIVHEAVIDDEASLLFQTANDDLNGGHEDEEFTLEY